MINVLVTGVGSLIGQGLLRALKSSALSCCITGTDYFAHAVGLYWVDRGYILPDLLAPGVTGRAWLAEIVRIIGERRIDVVLVGLDFEVAIFAENRRIIEEQTGAKVIVATSEAVAICKDKYRTALFLQESGFLFPDSCLPQDIETFLERRAFPLVVKPRAGFRSRDLFVVRDRKELAEAMSRCPDPVVQEQVGVCEAEYTCGTVCQGGESLSVIALRRDLKDGNTIRAVFDEQCLGLHEFVRRAGLALRSDGPFNFQLRLTERGPVVFEINPRFSGTTYMRTFFGVNEVEVLINKVHFGKDPVPVEWSSGVALRYYDDQFIPMDQFRKWSMT
ncbi:MAG: ATP-grasp domain-containing protein [Candidatus Omnitrophica bacterium]|nr:ATP-grasp domain-containing protein [Candidatus Omnitrophota bacterium]